MAEGQSMTTAEVVARTLLDEHADFLREAVAMVAAQLMEAEVSAEVGARRSPSLPASISVLSARKKTLSFLQGAGPDPPPQARNQLPPAPQRPRRSGFPKPSVRSHPW